MYPYGLIGNCETSALISRDGSLDWLCWPRPDSEPIFGKILDEKDGGQFSICPAGKSWKTEQKYISNTNVLRTTFTTEDGSVFRVTDFCPRFEHPGRIYRPLAVFRIVEPLSGNPSISVNICPIDGWLKNSVKSNRTNSHLTYEIRGEKMHLTTDMPLTYLDGTPQSLNGPVHFALTWGFYITEDLISTCRDYLEKTTRYWRTWVKHCTIPTLFQKEVIRSALALKLHCYEDTGAILAATTTSLPEEEGHNRNWDYRYCWLRDAAFVLSAFQNLGHFEEMEGFVKFILNILHKHEYTRERMSPVYALDLSRPVPETEHGNWAGFAKSQPVRSQNQAADHIQNDVYGELVLALAPVFFDERFEHLRDGEHEELLTKMVRHCIKYTSKPDAGLWEIREGWQEHTFSNLMCWAGLDRAAKLHESGFLKDLSRDDLLASINQAKKAVLGAAKDGAIRNGPTDPSFDASLLLMPLLRFDCEEARNTVNAIAEQLMFDKNSPAFLYRYRRHDDFGTPKSAFVICSFWLAQAYAKLGEVERAREVVQETLQSANHLGLFAEHFLPAKKLQLGNFPQAYSHVGLINAAFRVSPQWHDVI
jgi:GH15 family glucan-1,4-alpha-glucosidase